jgi:probable H4MPT-linked C1 transfer pathway protein
MNTRAMLGLDIGGANLKAALLHSGKTQCLTRPYLLWRNPEGLTKALTDLISSLPADELAITMTGELCDCFASKRQGVLHILDSVERVAKGRPVHVWGTDGGFHLIEKARSSPLLFTASNWIGLATWAGRYAPEGPALLFDVGSTTSDIVPLLDGKPFPRGRTDRERLFCSELIYCGVRRTPLMVFSPWVACEVFATTLDAFLLSGEIEEDPHSTDTADGRPATKHCAHARIARMMCEDLETTTETEREQLARSAADGMRMRLRTGLKGAVRHLPNSPRVVILAGSGEFIAHSALTSAPGLAEATALSVAGMLGRDVSIAACAHAVAVLSREMLP